MTDGAPLGIITKNVSTDDGAADVKRGRRRFAWRMLDSVRQLIPKSRTAGCCTHAYKGQVTIQYSHEHGSAHYGGVGVCGSVWACPICSPKITSRRRDELKDAITRARAMGLTILFVTLTFRHSALDTCESALNDIGEAWRRLRQGRQWQAIKAAWGIVGSVRALEITYGAAGWHPHIHALFFVDRAVVDGDMQALESDLWAKWRAALALMGRDGLKDVAVNCTVAGAAIGDYVSKYGDDALDAASWGAESEMTKAHLKIGKPGKRGASFTPWQLLAIYTQGADVDGMTAARAGALFVEYATALKGHHQLDWSPGLRGLLGMGANATDEELAELETEPAEQIYSMSNAVFGAVVRAGRRGDLLDLAGAAALEPDRDKLIRQFLIVVCGADLGP